jgi:hypothetical protein
VPNGKWSAAQVTPATGQTPLAVRFPVSEYALQFKTCQNTANKINLFIPFSTTSKHMYLLGPASTAAAP